MSNPLRIFLITLTGIMTCRHAAADDALFNYIQGSTPAEARADFNGTIGSRFTVNVAGLSVTQLGTMAIAGSGTSPTGFASSDGTGVSGGTGGGGGFYSGPIQVGLWSWDGTTATQVATADVTSTSFFSGGYRYATLNTPVELISGQTYLIGAYVGGGVQFFLDGFNTSQNLIASSSPSNFTLISSQVTASGSLVAPTGVDGTGLTGRWGVANMMVTAVPEPSSYAIVTAGLMGSVALVRRRRKTAR